MNGPSPMTTKRLSRTAVRVSSPSSGSTPSIDLSWAHCRRDSLNSASSPPPTAISEHLERSVKFPLMLKLSVVTTIRVMREKPLNKKLTIESNKLAYPAGFAEVRQVRSGDSQRPVKMNGDQAASNLRGVPQASCTASTPCSDATGRSFRTENQNLTPARSMKVSLMLNPGVVFRKSTFRPKTYPTSTNLS